MSASKAGEVWRGLAKAGEGWRRTLAAHPARGPLNNTLPMMRDCAVFAWTKNEDCFSSATTGAEACLSQEDARHWERDIGRGPSHRGGQWPYGEAWRLT